MKTVVFVSSTFIDLVQHRELVQDAVTRLEMYSSAMEFFGARPNTPQEECLRLVRSANIYIGIFGMRYGAIDLNTGKSMTHLEYEEAQIVNLPSLVYFLDENKHPVLPIHVETGESADKLKQFKNILQQNHVINYFCSAEDLAAKVTQDLVRLIGASEKRPKAQILSQLIENSVPIHPISKEQFDFLRQQLEEHFPQNISDSLLQEAFEVTLAGDRMAAAFILARGGSMDLRAAIDGLMSLDRLMTELLRKLELAKSTTKISKE